MLEGIEEFYKLLSPSRIHERNNGAVQNQSSSHQTQSTCSKLSKNSQEQSG